MDHSKGIPEIPTIPPFPFLTRDMLKFGRSSKLEIQLATMCAVTKTVTCRFITREGQQAFSFTNNGGGVDQSTNFTISEIPIFLALVTDDGSIQQGDCYAVARLLINGQLVYTFCAGYVSRHRPVCWPISGNESAVPGRGGIRTVPGNDPAAGAEITHTVPNGQLWKLLAMSFQLVTDATAGNRVPHINFNMPSGPQINVWYTSSQATNLTRNYSAYITAQPLTAAGDNDLLIGLPQDLYLPGNTIITTETLALSAGDNYGAPAFLVEQLYNRET